MKTIRLHPKAAEGSAEGMLNIGQKIKFYFGSLFYGEQVGHVAKNGTCLFRKYGKNVRSTVDGKIEETFDTVVDLNSPIIKRVKKGHLLKKPTPSEGVYEVDKELQVLGKNGWEIAKSNPVDLTKEGQQLAQSGSIYYQDANGNMRPVFTCVAQSPYAADAPYVKEYFYNDGKFGFKHFKGNEIIGEKRGLPMTNDLGLNSNSKVRLHTEYFSNYPLSVYANRTNRLSV